MQRKEKEAKRNNCVLETKFHELSKEINIFTSSTSTNTKAIAVNGIIKFLILGMLKYRETQIAIHKILMEFKGGKLNPLLITPLELEMEFLKISHQLGYKTRLPSMYFEELKNLLDVAVVHGEECLIFNIGIPLLGLDNYLVYKVIPFPTMTNGQYNLKLNL